MKLNPKEILKNLALLITTLIILLLVLEGATRLLHESKYAPEFKASGVPYYAFKESSKPEFKIVVFGDSFSQGPSANESYPAYLFNLLNRLNSTHKFTVYNFGSAGMTILYYIRLIQGDIKVLDTIKPDLVIVETYLGNDIFDTSYKLSKRPNWQYIRKTKTGEVETFASKPNWFFKHSAFLDLIWNQYWTNTHSKVLQEPHKSADVFLKDYNKDWMEAWGLYRFLLQNLYLDVKKANSKYLLVILPAGVQIHENAWEIENKRFKKMASQEWDHDHPNKMIDSFCKEFPEWNCFDITPYLKEHVARTGDIIYNVDEDCHFNQIGYRLTALLIYEKLIKEKMIPL